MFDLEYIFLQLRAISVGETVDFNIKCEECGKENVVTLDLTEAKIHWPETEVDPRIIIEEEIGLTLRSIRVKDIDSMEDDNDVTSAIIASIESIFDKDNVYLTDETDRSELETFVDSLGHKHLESIQKFIANQPKLEHNLKYTCKFCGHENEYKLSGLSDFFI
jgi:transcription elongation factor Elf1